MREVPVSLPFAFFRPNRTLHAMRHLSIFVTALGLTGSIVSAQDIEGRVLAVFEKNCAECHKEDEEPALHGGASLAKLRNDPKIITPGKADTSELFRRVSLPIGEKKHMPKSKGAPGGKDYRSPLNAEDIGLLKQWIEGGSAPSPARDFISDEQVTALIHQDLLRLPAEQQRRTRYLTLTNLHNLPPAFVAAADLDTSRAAVSKLINSLSYLPAITRPVAVDTQQTILRMDLSAYGWSHEFWDRIASFYPYAILSGSVPEREAQRLTGCNLPRIRADWFVFALAQPPLYHEALQIPGLDLKTDGADTELETRLGINVKRNLTSGRALRAGFEQSGVSQGNRLIEHHAQRDGGGYWKSYDFDKDRKDKPGGDLFTAPLGPPDAGLTTNQSHVFKQDGGEIIFALPNGLQGYLLVNAAGRLINRGPTNIVHDSSRKDSAIINGVSCMSCHKTGMFPPPEDKLSTDVLGANILPGVERRLFSQLHDAAKVKSALETSTARFVAALEKCGVNPAARDEPVRALYDRFLAPITAAQIASEFGQKDEHFLEDLLKSPEERLRSIASRLESGNTLPRQSFVSNFRDITEELGLGKLLDFLPPPFEEFGAKEVPPSREFTHHSKENPSIVAAAVGIVAGRHFTQKTNFKTGDLLTLQLKVDRACHLRVIYQPLHGDPMRVFPERDGASDRIAAGADILIPDPAKLAAATPDCTVFQLFHDAGSGPPIREQLLIQLSDEPFTDDGSFRPTTNSYRVYRGIPLAQARARGVKKLTGLSAADAQARIDSLLNEQTLSFTIEP